MHQNSRQYIKGFPKFECSIYSDIDLQSAISVSSTGNSRSFTELTDRLAFVNFPSPERQYVTIYRTKGENQRLVFLFAYLPCQVSLIL